MSLKNLLPTSVRKAVFDSKTLRDAWYFTLDNYDVMTGKSDELTPPRKLQHAIGAAFDAVGEEYFDYFVRLGGLKRTDNILDVGCGCGRMAVKLSKYINNEGVYEGFDIMRDCVEWCQKNITPQYGNIKFRHADILNKEYNSTGKISGNKFIFPYDDNYFDFVILTSVFTHLLPDDFVHYVEEISRVLKLGGKCFSTFLLLNGESLQGITDKKSIFHFTPQQGGYFTTNPDIPEVAIGLDELFVLDTLRNNGLNVEHPIHYGAWSGRCNFLSGQDIILTTKVPGRVRGGTFITS